MKGDAIMRIKTNVKMILMAHTKVLEKHINKMETLYDANKVAKEIETFISAYNTDKYGAYVRCIAVDSSVGLYILYLDKCKKILATLF